MSAPRPTREWQGPCEECARPYACANCRRPLAWLDGVGWLHGEPPQYAHEPAGCACAEPVHERHSSRHSEVSA